MKNYWIMGDIHGDYLPVRNFYIHHKNELSDNPDDNYSFVKKQYPKLDITILSCEKNTGPGLARQRALDACKTDWITFIDADEYPSPTTVLETFRPLHEFISWIHEYVHNIGEHIDSKYKKD